jgi:hypothetical protein
MRPLRGGSSVSPATVAAVETVSRPVCCAGWHHGCPVLVVESVLLLHTSFLIEAGNVETALLVYVPLLIVGC